MCEPGITGVLLDPGEGQVHAVAAVGEQADHIAEVADISAMQHEPYIAFFIEAHLDEVIPGTQCAQVIHVVVTGCAWVLCQDLLVSLVQLRPNVLNAVG